MFVKFSSIVFLSITSVAMSLETKPESKAITSIAMNQKTKLEPQASYNASSRIAVDDPCDIFISGSFIYWQPIQENMRLGIISDTTDDPVNLINGHDVDLNFEYKPGFKVGLGMNLDHDKWDTFIQYTWFRGTDKVKKSVDPNNLEEGLFPAWQIPDFLNPQYSSGSEKWTLRIHFIDWDLGRTYAVGKELDFRPFFGLRAAFIKQNLHVNYINVTPAALAVWPSTFIKQSSNSWGIGPRIGLSTHWKFCKRFRLYADGELDLLFTQYDLKSKQTSDTAFANGYVIKKNNVNRLRTHVEIDLGLGWGSYFSHHKSHIEISADYGFQVFFDQNMFRYTTNTQAVGRSFMPNGNLYIHGLTATIRFDF